MWRDRARRLFFLPRWNNAEDVIIAGYWPAEMLISFLAKKRGCGKIKNAI